ncbi:MAG: EamA-like transporter family protein [Marmoricola sp.]|nr:EamA-like transporter family protein [Marmoricola sp.]
MTTTAPVGLPVVAAVLLAAVLHAVWNAMAHAIDDQLVGFALMGVGLTAGSVVIVLVSPLPASESWPYLAASAVLHVAYNALLMWCYRIGEFGQVYPLARGTSPWLVAIAGAVFAGEHLSLIRVLGVVTISVGLASLVFVGGVPTRAARPAIAAALLTGVAIASYTTFDGLGVRHAGSVAGYAGWLFLLQGPVLPLVALGLRRRGLWTQLRPHLLTGLTGGVLSLAAYGLVLWAQTRGALAPVAALRETSVIVGAVIGAVVFGEKFGRWRIVATVLVAGGVVLVTL